MEECEVLIIGSGPAGLAAAIYASRGRRETCVLERGEIGGQLAGIANIENWPGDRAVSGPALAKRMADHATAFGARILEGTELMTLDLKKKVAKTSRGDIRFKALIIATGAREKKAGIPGEKELVGRGVSYCAICDAPFFKDKVVAVVGGGNSAMDAVAVLSKFASKIYLIHRRDTFRAEKAMQEHANNQKVEKVLSHEVISVNGKGRVQGVTVEGTKDGKRRDLQVDGAFFFIGEEPATDFLSGELKVEKGGYISANERMETSAPLVYAAGDVRATPLRQISTAVADGTVAAVMAEKALTALEEKDK